MSKLNKMSKFIAIMLTLVFSLTMIQSAPSATAAESTELEFKNLDLQIWPEYDDPRVLAIYSGTLINTSGKDFNGRVSFNVPKDIEVQMACEIVNGGGHSCQPYELTDKGDYQVLSWQTTKPIAPGQEYPIWLEYYYNPLKGSPDKTMTLEYVPHYKTQSLQVTIKEPLKSSNFKITPPPTSTSQDGEGFKNDIFNFQNVDSDKPVKLEISYTRSETKPSVEPKQQDAGGQGGSGDPLGTSAWQKPEVLIPVGLFIFVLVGFMFYSLYYTKNQPPTNRVRRIHNKYGKKSGTGSQKGGASAKAAKEKQRIRQMLLNGEITEETYHELMADLK